MTSIHPIITTEVIADKADPGPPRSGPHSDVVRELCAHGFRLLRRVDGGMAAAEGELAYLEVRREPECTLVHPSAYVDVDPRRPRPLRAYSMEDGQAEWLRRKLEAWIGPPFDRDAGTIFMLMAAGGGVQFTELGTGGKALRRENYAPNTLRDVDHVARDIGAADPCGRLVLLTGPPGTGKTHLIRSIVGKASPLRRDPAGRPPYHATRRDGRCPRRVCP